MALLGNLFDPGKIAQGEATPAFGLSAVVAYKEKADRVLAQQAELNATLEEKLVDLEDELRDLRYELHSLSHTEPDDPFSRAHDRWDERQDLLEKHISDVESEIADMKKEALFKGTLEEQK